MLHLLAQPFGLCLCLRMDIQPESEAVFLNGHLSTLVPLRNSFSAARQFAFEVYSPTCIGLL